MARCRDAARWAVVVPVKPLERAKSRLETAPLGVDRADLVLAMVQDTVAATLACPAVGLTLVVTDDPRAGAALALLGARLVPDEPDAGLNAAVSYGAQVARSGIAVRAPSVHRPRPGAPAPQVPVAAITADLPALRPHELAAALRAAAGTAGAGPAEAGIGEVGDGGRSFVADATGSGTTLLAALPGAGLDPRFGGDSARAHDATGAVRLDGDWPSLRHDVDTLTDLIAAARLGLGPHTAALVGRVLAALATGRDADGQAGGPAGERA
jgi:2-phospho-L-lactate/phosphoenolpyruvate guanylyltransferase